MRAPLSWIREFTAVTAPVPELVAALNQLGLEVEAVEEPGEGITGVVVARALAVTPHPNADTLTLVDIDAGERQTRVVCGAPNVVPGMTVPYAPPGATLPGGFTLERRTIRGEVSDGMLCSARELGLGEDHTGILALEAGAEPGDDVRSLLGLDDVIFDLSITPNRPDAMCIIGVARELAAHFKLDLVVPEPRALRDPTVTSGITVAVEDPERCPRYLGWVADVTVRESPAWMAQRLLKAGMRPISNVVDVTNYVLLERNQPLHAFDRSKLGGDGIVVRLATDGEAITTLDGVARELTREDLLICDAARIPQAIAGIMGGSTSEVDERTSQILLESAYFERMGIAKSSKRLKLRSESSARFERGIDPEAVAWNAERAMELLAEVADARVASSAEDAYASPVPRRTIRVRTRRVNQVLGTELDAEDVWDALAPLGIELDGAGDAPMTATVPTFRPDLEREIDLVEEVARRVGFDRIGRTVPQPPGQVGALTRTQRDRRTVADALVGFGASEAITLSLVSPADLARAGAPLDRVVHASNPLRAEESVLRTRILPGLLRVVAFNRSQGLHDVALFEQGHVFYTPTDGDGPLPDEREHLALALTGMVRRRPVEDDRPVDVYDAVDALRTVAEALGIAAVGLDAADLAGYRAGHAARVLADGDDIGAVGEVGAAVVDALRLEAPVVAFEVSLDRLFAASRRDRSFVPLSRYPALTFDLAFVLPDAVPAAAVVASLRAAIEPEVLEDVRVFDEFRSGALGSGRRSMAFALRLRAPDRTLTDAEVSRFRRRAIDAVVEAHGAELRS